MNTNNLYRCFHSIKEMRLIGKAATVGDNLYEVLGFYRTGKHLTLVMLEYDAERTAYNHNMEEVCDAYDEVMTNRREAYRRQAEHFEDLSATVREVVVDEQCYKICEGTSYGCHQVQTALLFAQFFALGWQPQDIGKLQLEDVRVITLMLEGHFERIPEWSLEPTIELKQCQSHSKHFVEMPITLEVGKLYEEKIYFTLQDTGEEHWIMLNEVYVTDIYAETMQKFDDPQIKAQMSEDELAALRVETEKRVIEMCPKGKGLLVVEYESDEAMQLDFHRVAYLDREPKRSNTATVFMARPDKAIGKLGQQLRVCLLDEAIDVDCKAVEAELFVAYKERTNEAIYLTKDKGRE